MVEGVEQECYDVRTSPDGMTTECWIISEVGKQFTVDYAFPPFTVCSAHLHIDGVFAAGHCVNYPNVSTTFKDSLKEVRTSSTTARPLKFSTIELTEDDQYLGTDVTESNTLKFWFQHATFDVPRYQTAAEFTNKKLPGSSKVHERTKKGLLAHGVGLGKEVASLPVTTCVPQLGAMIGTFIFRYTSRDILEARGIIERRRASPKLEKALDGNNTVNTGDAALQAKVVKLEKRVKELQQSQASSSSSSSQKTSPSSQKKVKRERAAVADDDILDLTGPKPTPMKKRRKVSAMEGEVLDLTLD